MEYRLTFHTLAIGSLAVCLSILAIAWILDLFGRLRRRPRYGMDHDDNTPGSDGRRPSDPESRHRPRTYPVEAFKGRQSADIALGRLRGGETRPALHRRAG